MKVGDLIRIKKSKTYQHLDDALLYIVEVLPRGYCVMILNGKYLGEVHYVLGRSVEIVSISIL